MGFVKTAEEVARARAILKRVRFVAAEVLQVEFLTDRDVIAALLPPGFEPAAEALASAKVGRWRSNCVGDYSGGALYVHARYKGMDAPYTVAMYMDAEPAIMYGREVLGEPKKAASSSLYRRGSAMHGFVERRGVRIIDLQADLKDDLGPLRTSSAAFNVKAAPAADGSSCEADAVVTHVAFENNFSKRLSGEGHVILQSNLHDPCGDIPVYETRAATYLEGDLEGSGRSVGTIDKDAFFPYLLGRMDDFTLLDTEAQFR